jgi:hypothetical protein
MRWILESCLLGIDICTIQYDMLYGHQHTQSREMGEVGSTTTTILTKACIHEMYLIPAVIHNFNLKTCVGISLFYLNFEFQWISLGSYHGSTLFIILPALSLVFL